MCYSIWVARRSAPNPYDTLSFVSFYTQGTAHPFSAQPNLHLHSLNIAYWCVNTDFRIMSRGRGDWTIRLFTLSGRCKDESAYDGEEDCDFWFGLCLHCTSVAVYSHVEWALDRVLGLF